MSAYDSRAAITRPVTVGLGDRAVSGQAGGEPLGPAINSDTTPIAAITASSPT